jgi:2-methylisocitrate lyase-like PEP mutase family enzyme
MAPVPPVETFRRLHQTGCFVMPNPWDVGSALYLQHLGFPALATTSAGLAFSRGRPDSARALGIDPVLAHVRDLAAACTVPINVDFQSGYADDPEAVATNVGRCVQSGCSGLSIEDATDDPATPLYERGLAVERIRAARRAIDASGVPVVLTARCEAWLVGAPDPASMAIDRLVAFAEAGADCLYAPGVRDGAMIAAIVKAVAPRAVNVLALPGLSVAELAGAGVRRVSVGGALARVAWTAFMQAARDLVETGSLEAFASAVSWSELNRLFATRQE